MHLLWKSLHIPAPAMHLSGTAVFAVCVTLTQNSAVCFPMQQAYAVTLICGQTRTLMRLVELAIRAPVYVNVCLTDLPT